MLNGETYVYYIYKTPAAAVTLAKRKKKEENLHQSFTIYMI